MKYNCWKNSSPNRKESLNYKRWTEHWQHVWPIHSAKQGYVMQNHSLVAWFCVSHKEPPSQACQPWISELTGLCLPISLIYVMFCPLTPCFSKELYIMPKFKSNSGQGVSPIYLSYQVYQLLMDLQEPLMRIWAIHKAPGGQEWQYSISPLNEFLHKQYHWHKPALTSEGGSGPGRQLVFGRQCFHCPLPRPDLSTTCPMLSSPLAQPLCRLSFSIITQTWLLDDRNAFYTTKTLQVA